MDVLSPGGLALIYIYIFFQILWPFVSPLPIKVSYPWGEGQERASMDLKKPPAMNQRKPQPFFYNLCIQAQALVKLVSFSGGRNLFFL